MSDSAGNTPRKSPAAHLTGHAFKPGVSGNPTGRPKGTLGLAGRIRAATADGQTLLDFLMGVVAGDEKGVTVRDRLQAAQMLLDRGFGKAVETSVLIQGDERASAAVTELATLADEHLETLARSLKSTATPAQIVSGPSVGNTLATSPPQGHANPSETQGNTEGT